MVTSAIEARKLMEAQRDMDLKHELDKIDQIIRQEAQQGEESCEFSVSTVFLIERVRNSLLSAGYVIVDEEAGLFTISWNPYAVRRSEAW